MLCDTKTNQSHVVQSITSPTHISAADLDRQADLLLFEGRHAAAEKLSHYALELRQTRARR